MTRCARWILAVSAAIIATLSGCSRDSGSGGGADAGADGSGSRAAADSVVRLGSWSGTLPCADCSGIRTRLTLFARHAAHEPLVYHLQETYLGTRDGDRTVATSGRWTLLRGTPADPSTEAVQIAFDKPAEQRTFRKLGEDSLRLLDRELNDIDSNLPYTLGRDDGAGAPVWADGGRTPAMRLQTGQEFFVRLSANHTTGFQWALADTARTVVAPQATHYVQDTPDKLAIGVGGHEYWRLRAVGTGTQTLTFVYRRPWETQSAPARTATIAVTVR